MLDGTCADDFSGTMKEKPLRLFSYAAMLLATALVAPPAVADEVWNPCKVEQAELEREVFKRLVGNWTVKNGAGHAVMSGGGVSMPVPMGPEPDESLDFVLDGDTKLRALNWSDMSEEEIEFTILIGETKLDEAVKAIGKGATEEDIATTVGCTVDQLPRISASGVRADKDGKMVWTSDFVVISDKLLHGAMSFTLTGGAPGSIVGYRLVSLKR